VTSSPDLPRQLAERGGRMCRKRRAQLFSALFLNPAHQQQALHLIPSQSGGGKEGSADRDDSASRADVAQLVQVGSGLQEG
jgi:hypothetical protein